MGERGRALVARSYTIQATGAQLEAALIDAIEGRPR
jgi:hypothetical protein